MTHGKTKDEGTDEGANETFDSLLWAELNKRSASEKFA